MLAGILARNKQLTKTSHFLPARWRFSTRLPGFGIWTISIDARVAAESFLLLISLAGIASRLSQYAQDARDLWVQRELYILMMLSFIYLTWMHSSLSQRLDPLLSIPPISLNSHGPRSPRLTDPRDGRRSNPISLDSNRNEFGYIWMTVPKNYRNSSDDGIFSSLMIGPMISAAMLYSALRLAAAPTPNALLPPTWRIEPPLVQAEAPDPLSALEALVLARRSLVDLGTLCPTILLIHVCASWWTEHLYRKLKSVPDGERGSVPRLESKRAWRYMQFSLVVSTGLAGLRALMPYAGCGIWQNMRYVDVLAAAFFFQFTLYVAIRLAHRGFSLGELGLVAFGATVLFAEMVDLTAARIWPATIPFIKTFRLPTPLLIFQLALIPGALLTGFLLSPLLVLSRRLAQQPVRRLRYPQQQQKRRRMLAAGFYLGAVLVGGGLVGLWARWSLGGRDPWVWAVLWLLEGRRRWSRPALLAYWAALGIISVAGWTRQLARSRRYRPRNQGGGANVDSSGQGQGSAYDEAGAPPSTDASGQTSPVAGVSGSQTLGLAFSGLPNLPNGAGMSQAATELFDAADKRVPLLSLNARRKYFHGLAVAMFLPGIAFDPAFTHLSFSAAFALFTFAEYVRYFALYPFGASVHVFMNEFLDAKDSGTAVLSHFYLLTGCAGALWLEAPSEVLQFTGVLTLGVGDAVASIVGKRIGRRRWSATTSKSIEGSIAFTVSVVGCAWILRACGFTEAFSVLRYTIAIAWGAALEALSIQNDNLTLPLYIWSVLLVAVV